MAVWTASQSQAMARLVRDETLVQAGAWLEGFFRGRPTEPLRLPLQLFGRQDPCTDVTTPDWPFPADSTETREALTTFVHAGLLSPQGNDWTLTPAGKELIPAFPLYHVRNQDALARKYPDLKQVVSGARVLDAGCGLGPFSIQLSDLGARQVLALDYAIEHLRITRTLADIAGARNVTPVRGSIEQLPIADASLDLVFCRVTLSLVHKQVAMREFTRVLKPGGHMLLAMHAPRFFTRRIWAGLRHCRKSVALSGMLGLLGGLSFDVFHHEPHWRMRRGRFRMSYERPATFQRLLHENGLTLVSWERGPAKPYVWVTKRAERLRDLRASLGET